MNLPPLAHIDEDGAIREAEGRISRHGLLRAAALGGGGATVIALGKARAAHGASKRDVEILNYALTLEYLQAAFYTEGERLQKLGPKAASAARTVGAVERAHVAAFRDALGTAAVARPRFNFKGVTEDERRFLKTAVAFEDLAVAAYKAQAPKLEDRSLLAVAVSIHSVEARHAAWMRHLFGIRPAASAFDEPIEKPEILRIVRSTRFITATPATSAQESPEFTG
ncbi:hypothetical protein BH09ACT13_BH09ACT13_03910 [soil metagenome]